MGTHSQPGYSGVRLFKTDEFENSNTTFSLHTLTIQFPPPTCETKYLEELDVLLCSLHHCHQRLVHSFVVVVAVHVCCDVTQRRWGEKEG